MTISIIIPALHEQERINGLIEHLKGQGSRVKGQEKHEFEIIVVDGDAEGSTIAVISDPAVIRLKARQGRGNQLATGVASANGGIILMLHADTLLPDNAFQFIRAAIIQGADWGAFRLCIDAPSLSYRIIERAVDLRCKLFTLPYGDQAIFVKNTALQAIGGIPPIPLMEDVELARRLRQAGYVFTLLPQRVSTSARRWQKNGTFRRTLKNWWLLLRYLVGVDPTALAKEYR
jgi:rSAM/selenodomain-associated transferase 2